MEGNSDLMDLKNIDRYHEQALVNWVELTRTIDGAEVTYYANKVTGEERDLKPNFYFHGKAVAYADRSCYLLGTDSPVRRRLVQFIVHPIFDQFILACIILNSLFLALPDNNIEYGIDLEYDLAFKDESSWSSWWSGSYNIFVFGDKMYEADPDKSTWTQIPDSSELFFTTVFALEAVFKIIGMGFVVGKGSYLRDGWNIIDFVVVISSLLTVIPGFPRISALRTVRVMRPLRSLSRMPSMRAMINTLINSIPALLNVMTLLLFVFMIFGILAIQIWSGVQLYRCRLTSKPLAAPNTTLVFNCQDGVGEIEPIRCSASKDDWSSKFECSNMKECVIREHHTLMGEVFGADNMVDAPEMAKRYASAMVTRVYINPDTSVVTPLHYCGYEEDLEVDTFPSFYEGLFPDHDRIAFGEDVDKAKKISSLSPDDGPWAQKNWNCFWPIYDEGRVCSKSGVGLGGGMNTCGRRELPFPTTLSDWLLPNSELVRAAMPLLDAEKRGEVSDNNLSGELDESSNNCSVADSYFEGLHQNSNNLGNVSAPQCYDIESYYADRRQSSIMFVHTTCGSDMDFWGNRRFESDEVHEAGIFTEDLAYGYTQFQHIFGAFQTIFQAITEEGWTDIMYQIMDADNSFIAATYFCSLIIVGSFICLNLTLAVMWQEFTESKAKHEAKMEREKRIRDQFKERMSQVDNSKSLSRGSKSDENDNSSSIKSEELLSFYCFGLPGSHENSSNEMIRKLNVFVKTSFFEVFIVFCIILNTATLSMDRYSQPKTETDILEIINFGLTMIFTLEMVLKIAGLGLREYVQDKFNQFDAVIVVASIIELGIAPPSFLTVSKDLTVKGGALSAMRAFRLFRLFKLARSWKSLHHLLATMAKTLADVTSFALLLFLFIYIFALCGMQFFANRFRFDDDGYALELTTETIQNMSTTVWNSTVNIFDMPTSMFHVDENTALNPLFWNAEPVRNHFDDFPWACTTVFQVLSGENWNAVLYDAWRSTSWLATLFFALLVIGGIMIVLELFVAVLLGNFENSEDDEDEEEKIDISPKAQERKKFKAKQEEEEESTKEDENTKNNDEKNNQEDTLFERIFKATECNTNNLKIVPIEVPESRKVTKKLSGLNPFGTARKTKSEFITEDKSLRGTALYCFSPHNPFRKLVSTIVFHSWFDRCILTCIVISSLLLAAESPLDDPDSVKATIFEVMDGTFTIIFIIELILKHITLGFMLYWADPWNDLDGLIVGISIIVNAMKFYGEASSLSSLRALRTLRVLRPLRMINRAPGLKRVVKALLYSFPKILDVLVVCALFFLIFAIVGINFLKGRLNVCAGDITSTEHQFLLEAKWSKLDSYDTAELTWTWKQRLIDEGSTFATCSRSVGPASNDALYYFDDQNDGAFTYNFASNNSFFQHWDSEKGQYEEYDHLEDWQNEKLPYNYNTDRHDISCNCDENGRWECLTSKDACLALRATGRDVDWVKVVYQSFDDIFSAMSCLLEISTTEGWVDVMYAAVDARGLDMQPDRHTNAFQWVVFFVAFIIWGSFFVLNLFVGVVCDTFNTMQKKFGSDFLMTEHQKKWVEMRKKISRLGPHLKAHVTKHEPESEWEKKLHLIVKNPKFDNFIMGCIMMNAVIMMLVWPGQSGVIMKTNYWLNFMFAIIFTIEAVMKLVVLRMQYFDDGWNVFDFVIVMATDIFIIIRYSTSLDLVSLATVMRSFRVLRIVRLIRGAKELRKLINTLVTSLPQLTNVALFLVLFLFIFGVMGVQMFAKIAFEEAYNEHANFQTFAFGVLTLMRATTGENWNGMMYDMSMQTEECVDDPEFSKTQCGFEGAIEECLPLNGCGKPMMAQFFWVAFTMLVSFMVLNLFVALIMEAFEDSDNEENTALSDDQWDVFCRTWVKFIPKLKNRNDMKVAMRMEMNKVVPFFKELPFPMGFKGSPSVDDEESKSTSSKDDSAIMEELQSLNLQFTQNKKSKKMYAHFSDTAAAAAKRAVVHTSVFNKDNVLDELHVADDALDLGKKKGGDDFISLTPAQYFGAIRIASAYRAVIFRNTLEARQKKFMDRKEKMAEKKKKKKTKEETKKEVELVEIKKKDE